MPVPGSLRRRPIDEGQIAGLLSQQFSLPTAEILAYLKLLDTSDLNLSQLSDTMRVDEDQALNLVNSMLERGLVIEVPGSPKRYAPLHPRMMLTNLFKIYEQGVVLALREHRAIVDRVVNQLTPIFEDREAVVTEKKRASSTVP